MRYSFFYYLTLVLYIVNFNGVYASTFLQKIIKWVKHTCDELPSGYMLSNKNISRILLPRFYSHAAIKKKHLFAKIRQEELFWEDINDYEIGEFLGNGSYGEVYRATKDNQTYIIKMLKRFDNISQELVIEKEVKLYKVLESGPNIGQLYKTVRDPTNFSRTGYVGVMEFIKMVNYRELYPRLTSEDIKYYIYMTLMAVNYAHSQGVMHRDLKPSNIGIDPETKKLRIIDWGIAEIYLPNATYDSLVGTLSYRAPELLLGHKAYHYGVDIWAIGCIFASMTFNKIPFFHADTEFEMIRKINKHFGTTNLLQMMAKHQINYPFKKPLNWRNGDGWKHYLRDFNRDRINNEGLDLLSLMLVLDFEKRITAKEALAHPYFDSIRKHIKENNLSHLLYTKPDH